MAAIKRWFEGVVERFKSLFWKQEMELTLVGLQNSGKTTLVNVLSVREREFFIYLKKKTTSENSKN